MKALVGIVQLPAEVIQTLNVETGEPVLQRIENPDLQIMMRQCHCLDSSLFAQKENAVSQNTNLHSSLTFRAFDTPQGCFSSHETIVCLFQK